MLKRELWSQQRCVYSKNITKSNLIEKQVITEAVYAYGESFHSFMVLLLFLVYVYLNSSEYNNVLNTSQCKQSIQNKSNICTVCVNEQMDSVLVSR